MFKHTGVVWLGIGGGAGAWLVLTAFYPTLGLTIICSAAIALGLDRLTTRLARR